MKKEKETALDYLNKNKIPIEKIATHHFYALKEELDREKNEFCFIWVAERAIEMAVKAERLKTIKEIDLLGQKLLNEKNEEIRMAKRNSQIIYAKNFFTGAFYALEDLKKRFGKKE